MVHAVLRDPANWVLGALGSVVAVGGAVLFDPFGAAAVIVSVFVSQAPNIFTLSSLLLAFADRIGGVVAQYQTAITVIWVLSLVLFAAGVWDKIWDGLEERLL